MPETHDINDPNHFVYYRYVPSLPAAAIFVVAFALTTALHTFQIVKKRTWYFIPLVIGGLFETTGYIGRILSHHDQWKLGPYIMQSLLLLVAPALFAASIYIILGRVILMVDGERFSLIRQRRLTMTFVIGDIFSFLVQSSGGGILGSAKTDQSKIKLGQHLILVGLFLQLLFFGFFVIVAGIFHFRLSRARKNASKTLTVNIDALPWKRHLVALYVASGLILVRSLIRIIEYLQGNAGYLLRREVFLYIFDALPMLAVMVIFNWIHPSQITDICKRGVGRSTEDAELTSKYQGSDGVIV